MPVLEAAPAGLAGELASARIESDKLFDLLQPDALFERPIAERHRVIFYIGHLDCFDALKICGLDPTYKSPDTELDRLFEAGIDPDSNHLPSDTPADWPVLKTVRDYVMRCRARVDARLEHSPAELVSMTIEHRLMHLETLAYMFHSFPFDQKRKPSGYRTLAGNPERVITNNWQRIASGNAILGKAEDGAFGWDNEYARHTVEVPEFRMQQFAVSNGEYLEFVKQGSPKPHFWVERDGAVYQRCMFGEIPLPLDWPVYVTQQEAQNYASAHGLAIASEAQFHRAAYGETEQAYPWDGLATSPDRGNFDFRQWDPEPVDASPLGDSASGIRQLVGNGWEWTSTPFAPFVGFASRPEYPGYSANFFDGEHYVMKGGSARTASRLLRRTFRNWFRRDYPYTYAKFRCIDQEGS